MGNTADKITGLSMNITALHSLDLLTLPVWIVSPHTEELVFANAVARELMQDPCFSPLRKGIFSTYAQNDLTMYLSDLKNHHYIVEILTVYRNGEETAMASRLSINSLPDIGDIIVFEGIETPGAQGLKASRSATYQRKKQGFYARFFLTNSAPMLLIDPSRDGLIVDANLSALTFYGYSHDVMCQKPATYKRMPVRSRFTVIN